MNIFDGFWIDLEEKRIVLGHSTNGLTIYSNEDLTDLFNPSVDELTFSGRLNVYKTNTRRELNNLFFNVSLVEYTPITKNELCTEIKIDTTGIIYATYTAITTSINFSKNRSYCLRKLYKGAS